MKHTSMYNAGYRYYVYVGPGDIRYFRTINEANDCVDETGGNLGEVT
jgi:hypothetical protein